MQLVGITTQRRIIALVLGAVFFLLLALPTTNALAASKTTQKNFLFYVKYPTTPTTWVTYAITVLSYYTVDYTTKNVGSKIQYTLTKQSIGGAIANADRQGYYPFDQNVYRGWVKYYKNSSYVTSWEGSEDTSGSIVDPDDKPFGFIITSTVYLYSDAVNELKPYMYWYANGTIPFENTLAGKPINF